DPFERTIRRVLRDLARQRVRAILQPGNVFVIDNSIDHDDETDAALRTCWLRGWVEPLDEKAVPVGQVAADGRLPNPLFTGATLFWRITDSGWSVIRRSQMWVLGGFLIALLSLAVALFSLLVALPSIRPPSP